MKKISGWLLPVLLLCNLIMFLKDYISTGNVNFTTLCIIFAITPIAVKDKLIFSKSRYYTYFSAFMVVLAAGMLILQSIKTM